MMEQDWWGLVNELKTVLVEYPWKEQAPQEDKQKPWKEGQGEEAEVKFAISHGRYQPGPSIKQPFPQLPV